MTLKYKWHSYGDVSEQELEVPDDTVFIHVHGDVGPCLHNGFGHYLGGSKQEIEKDNAKFGLRTYKDFLGISLFSFSNVVFETDIKAVPAEEFYSRFDIGNYYIFRHTRTKTDFKITNEGDTLLYVPTKIIPARLVSVSKIVRIRSQYLVDVLTCTVSSWIDIDDSEVKGISLSKNLYLSKILDNYFGDVSVRKDCDEEFSDALNQVLNIVGKKVGNTD